MLMFFVIRVVFQRGFDVQYFFIDDPIYTCIEFVPQSWIRDRRKELTTPERGVLPNSSHRLCQFSQKIHFMQKGVKHCTIFRTHVAVGSNLDSAGGVLCYLYCVLGTHRTKEFRLVD